MNLLNKKFYISILPNIFTRLAIGASNRFENWLDWGAYDKTKIVKMGLNVKIDGESGTYFGEWKRNPGRAIPYGRGVLKCKDKV